MVQKHHKIISAILLITSAIFFSLSLYLNPVFALPPTTAYDPGYTTNPDCAPGDTNCTVSAPVTTNSISNYAVSSLSGGSGFIVSSATGTVVLSLDIDSTLTTSTKLGLNLNNANTWLGAQTFSATTTFATGTFSGYVGIGTTTPIRPLSIVDKNSSFYPLAFYDANSNFIGDVYLGTATNRQIGWNLTGTSGQQGVADNWVLYRFGGADNKITMGDTGTNAWIQSKHKMNFFAGAIVDNSLTPQIVLDTNGYVGIGTTTPATLLHLSGATPGLRIDNTSASGRQFIFRNGSDTAGTFDIYDNTSGTSRLAITSAGDMGLGTTTPNGTIHIYRSSGWAKINAETKDTSNYAVIQSLGDAGQYLNMIAYGSATIGNALGVPAASAAMIRSNASTALVVGTAGSIPLIFSTNDIERMRIISSGYVGIGTTVPSSTLHVLSTTEQLRLGYNATNYTSFTAGPDGALTIAPTNSATTTISNNLFVSGGTMGLDQTDNMVWTNNTQLLFTINGVTQAAIKTAQTFEIDSIVSRSINASLSFRSYENNDANAIGFAYDTNSSLTTTGAKLAQWKNATVEKAYVDKDGGIYAAGSVGIGTTTPSAALHVVSTTEQLRLGYNGANYTSFIVGSGGALTITPTNSATTTISNGLVVGGKIFLADGAVTAPELSFTADTDLGFYRIGADNIGLATNGALLTDWSATAQTFTKNSLGASTSNTLKLVNDTAVTLAASTTQQVSPALYFKGSGWGTTASAAQTTEWQIYNLPVSGTTQPTNKLSFDARVNGTGSFNQKFTIDDSTNATTLTLPATSGIIRWLGDNTRLFGTATRVYLDVGGHTRIDSPVDDSLTLKGDKADGASSVGVILDNLNSLITAGSKITSFRNAGVEKAYVDKDGGIYAAGNVGVGTTTPTSLLSVSNNYLTTINTPLFTITSSTAGTVTTTAMTVLANGSIGLGTASVDAGYQMKIVGLTPGFLVQGTTSAGSFGMGFTTVNGFGTEGLKMYYNGNTGNSYIDSYYSAGGIYFRTKVASTAVDALTILPAGNIGIMKTAPTTWLDVQDTSAAASNTEIMTLRTAYYAAAGVGSRKSMTWRDGTNIVADWETVYDGTKVNQIWGHQYNNGSYQTSDLMTLTGNGNLGIGTTTPAYKFQVYASSTVEGHMDATGAWANTSDERLKKNIVTLDSALDKVMQLRGVRFDWVAEENSTSSSHVGFIAQEMEQIFPQFVSAGSDGIKGVAYGALTPVLVEAIKEQQGEIANIALVLPSNFTSSTLNGIKIDDNVLTTEITTGQELDNFDWLVKNTLKKLGMLIKDGVAKFKELIAGKIIAQNELCVGDTCVNEDQLKNILNNNGVSNATINSNPAPTPSPIPDPVPETPTIESMPEIIPNVPAVETLVSEPPPPAPVTTDAPIIEDSSSPISEPIINLVPVVEDQTPPASGPVPEEPVVEVPTS